jgi:hypothetical protein
MTTFQKFDPHAFLERERLAPASAKTLATLATLAGHPLKNGICGTASKVLSQRDTGALVAKSSEMQRDAPIVEHSLDHQKQSLTPTPAKVAKLAKVQRRASASGYQSMLDALELSCPDFVETRRWRQAVGDGQQFLASWSEQANAFGWTARELFGLHTAPERPLASYRRLARYDETGLIWLLRGRPVVALTEAVAAIQGTTAVLTYRKINKPALGSVGDSLDDMERPQ